MLRTTAIAVSSLVLIAAIVPAARAEVTAAAVDESIKAGVQYLLSRQDKASGAWAEYKGEPGGLTALITLALLNCGVPKDHEQVKAALDYLEKIELPQQTYSTSLQIMVFAQADPVNFKLRIHKLAGWLESHQIREAGNDTKGGWSYRSTNARADNSNTQFAMLALHEAERAGVKVDEQTWQLALNYWVQPGMQHPNGGYGYERGHPPSGSMTCAAIASLIIAYDRLSQGEARVENGRIQCCGNQDSREPLDNALKWMANHFSVDRNPSAGIGPLQTGGSPNWLLYYLYGMERVGRMSGQRFIGDHDWYREGCAKLLKHQKDTLNNSWVGDGIIENDPLVATPLALLFLSKGRRPVVIGKLKHQPDAIGGSLDWNHHARAIQNLTMRIEKDWRRDLSWQTIDFTLKKPVLNAAGKPAGETFGVTPADLLEAPVLFLSGENDLKFTPEQKKTLKTYVESGGFIFAEACNGNGCSGAAFDRDFRALMKELFPDSELRMLPFDHAVWYAQEKVDPKHLPKDPEFMLWGLDACCRTSVVYCPRSLSCYWELAHAYRESSQPQEIRDEIDCVARIGVNVVSYATARELKSKLDRPQIAVSNPGGKSPRGALVVAKLSHGGGSDDAPSALNNLLAVMEQQLQMRVDYEKRLVAPTDEKLFTFPLIFMHGRRSFGFSPAERKALKDYLGRGGFLFADAICANKEFADSLRAELKKIYPDASFARIPPSHEMFSEALGGFRLQSVMLRDPQIRDDSDPLTARLTPTTPLLEGLEIDGRIAVILSPYDLSCALEKGVSLECKGYIPADAARIGANVLLYALQQ
jgi:hypothetical protein